jgi:hypothetical protein
MRETFNVTRLIRATAEGDNATLELARERRLIAEFQAGTAAYLRKIDGAIEACEETRRRLNEQRLAIVDGRLAAGGAAVLSASLP